ncbi:MAG: hypothetical protein HFI78_07065 [Lachnospiraceae bacterium]|jgi:hypothetical protein|nr:hypothetical protein [Lachnospiraceae bacterium]
MATWMNLFSGMQYGLGFIYFKRFLKNYDLKDCFEMIASGNYNFEQLKMKLGA